MLRMHNCRLPISFDSQILFEEKSTCGPVPECAKNSFAILVMGGILAIPNLSLVGAKSRGSVSWRSLEGDNIGVTVHGMSARNFKIS